MSALARFACRRRTAVMWGWLVLLLALAAAALSLGTAFRTSVDLPDSESATAYSVLAEAGAASDTQDGRIVWRTDGTGLDDSGVQSEVEAVLADVAALPGVEQVTSPYSADGAAQLNVEQHTAYATVSVTDDADVEAIREAAQELDSSSYDVALGSGPFVEEPAALTRR